MKIEEIQHSSVNSFVTYAGNAFTGAQITEKEREMMTTLKWKIYPDTLNTWMDSYLNQWDLFVSRMRFNPNLIKLAQIGYSLPLFKQK
jgi:hypothetical protein